MKYKQIYMFLLITLLIFLLTGCNNNQQNTPTANGLNAEISANNVKTANDNNNSTKQVHIAEHDIDEEELASFSTKLSGKDTPRSRNIKITTSKLNGTTIENGNTFSFNDIIGNPSESDGYEEADSFDANGKTVKTLGGGNCQVSSTLYNVVLQISDLEVKERHAHVKPVHYVEKDKDATVSFGSVDFKFKNNTSSNIKIYADADLNGVNIRIVKVKRFGD